MLRLNGEKITPTIFPDKTSQVWKIPKHLILEGNNVISWDFENESEFLQIAQLKSLLDSYIVWSVELNISYLPYGRQDKPIANDTTFALTPFAKLLNSLHFNRVRILDPHSEVATELIEKSTASYPDFAVNKVIRDCKIDVVCYPDKGAYDKYSRTLNVFCPIMKGEKVRDQSTGNITSYKLNSGFLDIKGTNVLIVDDICDGGMTFKLLAKELLASGVKEVHLFVTHGIFSKGLETLRESGIQRIFTHDGEKG